MKLVNRDLKGVEDDSLSRKLLGSWRSVLLLRSLLLGVRDDSRMMHRTTPPLLSELVISLLLLLIDIQQIPRQWL